MTRHPSVTFVIMAGGKGERLWPLVRTTMPKVCLAPDGTRSLLLATIDRLRSTWPRAHWLIVTTEGQAEAIRRVVPPALRSAVIVEPEIKNTAACITLAAVATTMRDPRHIMVIVPADHWIEGLPAFRQAVRAAIHAAAAEETIVTIGIRPSSANPGLGYLCAGAPWNHGRHPRVYRLARFIEKPSPMLAARLIQRPHTYWNSGMFIGRAETFLAAITQWLPAHAKSLGPLANGLRGSRHQATARLQMLAQRAGRVYNALEAISFDHGVMNHLTNGVVVEGQFLWADLGSWDTWARLGRASRRTVAVDSRNVTVVGHEQHLVATIGVRDLLVVHTPTATLICHPDRAQAVREVVRQLWAESRFATYR